MGRGAGGRARDRGEDTTWCSTSWPTSSTWSTTWPTGPHCSTIASTRCAGTRCAPRCSRRCRPESTVLRWTRTQRRTRPSSSPVATEAFFDAPLALETHEPDLFTILRDYYGQDPAASAPRRGDGYEWVTSQGLWPTGTTASGGGIGPPGSPGVHVSGATSSAGFGSVGRSEERRSAPEVERVEQVVGVGVAVGQCAEVPLRLDELEHRRVVVRDVRDVVAPGVGRHDHRRHPERQTVVHARQVGRHVDVGRDVVGAHRGRRRHVVVVAAVLVVGPDQHGLRPVR